MKRSTDIRLSARISLTEPRASARGLLKLAATYGLASTLLGGLALAADLEPGKKIERTACVACHSLRIIESQRLSAAAWGKEIDKMVGWGAVVPEKQVLLDYLATEFSNTKPVPTPETSKSAVNH